MNNAGYGHFGCIEELTEAKVRAQLETNFFGALWTTQAAIPLFREQGGGHIVQVNSVGGVLAFPSLGAYHASKWALEGFTEALAGEVATFGIRPTTLIEPGAYATNWSGPPRPGAPRTPLTRASGTRSAVSGPTSRATRLPHAPRSSRSWTPSSRHCASSSAKRRWRSLPATTNHGSRPGGNGSRCRYRHTAADQHATNRKGSSDLALEPTWANNTETRAIMGRLTGTRRGPRW